MVTNITYVLLIKVVHLRIFKIGGDFYRLTDPEIRIDLYCGS
jgi:hypothetical protein